MSNRFFMGVDFGTQGVRCGIFDQQGQVAAVCEKKYETYYPQPGWTEQKPSEWAEKLAEAIEQCYQTAGEGVFSNIDGMAVCTTASTVLAIGADDQPLRDAILWMDNRAKEQMEKINATGHAVLRYAGGEDSVEWLVPKMLWLKENQPDVYEAAERIVEMQDYVNHYLTGRWCASVSQATCKSNYVEERGGFDRSFFEAIGLPEFSEKADTDVLKQGEEIGEIRPELAKAFHLPSHMKVYQGGIDAHVNMIGLGVCRPGDMGIVMGTSFVHLALAEKPAFQEGIWGPYKDAVVPDLYCMEGGQVSAGSITKWFLREFDIKGENPYLVIAEEAEKVAPGCEGVVALDFFQGNRTPYKDPTAKGVFYGLTLSHTKAHLYRAILESIAYGTRNIIEKMQSEEMQISSLMGCGGVTFNRMWLKIISDVTGKPIVLTEQSGNAGVLGCAVTAAVGSGAYDSFPAATDQMVHITETIQPSDASKEAYEQAYQKYLMLYQNLKDLMKK